MTPIARREKFLDIDPLYEVSSVVLPLKGGLGHPLVETSLEGPRIDGLNLNIEGLQFFLKRFGDALQGVLAREIGRLPPKPRGPAPQPN